ICFFKDLRPCRGMEKGIPLAGKQQLVPAFAFNGVDNLNIRRHIHVRRETRKVKGQRIKVQGTGLMRKIKGQRIRFEANDLCKDQRTKDKGSRYRAYAKG
ncbi:MAG TPA: hypothetical protein VEM15_03045, partial [Thermodesulfobacteriota bacterium]|nr:hypothetical protein [Thermodesulfobacteriota bacterium]